MNGLLFVVDFQSENKVCFKGVIICKIHFSNCLNISVLEVCVHIHPIMIKIHPVFFLKSLFEKSPFLNQAVLRFLSEWRSSVQPPPPPPPHDSWLTRPSYLRPALSELKAPIYFKRNRRTNWYDVISSKIRPKRSLFGVRSGSSKQLTKTLLNTFELPLVRGDYAIGRCVLELHLLWRAIFFFPVHFSFNKGQAGEQHLQVTNKINTLCRIAELPQIYPHLYDRSWRDFKYSEKAFNS